MSSNAKYIPAAEVKVGDHLPTYAGDVVSIRETKTRLYVTIRNYATDEVAEAHTPIDKRQNVLVGSIAGVNGK